MTNYHLYKYITQTVDKLEEKRVCLQFFILKNVPADFRNPLPFRLLSAKPHQSKRLFLNELLQNFNHLSLGQIHNKSYGGNGAG
ncbi:hypothetical protein [Peribacillus phoenicis]|uniref:hypothetical protein n=1 Tax=unclassified Peribacillus TaxID=2675266 RepID=UPI0039A1C5D4